eukprot:g12613.t1
MVNVKRSGSGPRESKVVEEPDPVHSEDSNASFAMNGNAAPTAGTASATATSSVTAPPMLVPDSPNAQANSNLDAPAQQAPARDSIRSDTTIVKEGGVEYKMQKILRRSKEAFRQKRRKCYFCCLDENDPEEVEKVKISSLRRSNSSSTTGTNMNSKNSRGGSKNSASGPGGGMLILGVGGMTVNTDGEDTGVSEGEGIVPSMPSAPSPFSQSRAPGTIAIQSRNTSK